METYEIFWNNPYNNSNLRTVSHSALLADMSELGCNPPHPCILYPPRKLFLTLMNILCRYKATSTSSVRTGGWLLILPCWQICLPSSPIFLQVSFIFIYWIILCIEPTRISIIFMLTWYEKLTPYPMVRIRYYSSAEPYLGVTFPAHHCRTPLTQSRS